MVGNENSDTLSSWAPKSLQTVTAAAKIKRHLLLGRKAMTNLDNVLKRFRVKGIEKVEWKLPSGKKNHSHF